ncbi:MAG TPA: TIGR03557 family F420-dependent LLM class oxidoreductase [Actinomycetota bacterium]|nr:TIGR03557 family F420-dependent LLM class oxidoreductase [Actinomycetota bacterium]
MAEFGYAISSEEHAPRDLVRNAKMAEDAGFSFALISDHYHPWVDRQGHSPFVWNIIGGISQATERLRLGTGVTCPTIRIHPAILAQAAATSAAMMPGRFFFGVGSGENLNEHILADRWPPIDVRLEMLEEAIEVIRLLWRGGSQSHRGRHYTVENARIYTLPEQLPPIMVAASGPKSAELAGRVGEGLITTAPDEKTVQAYRKAGGSGEIYGQVTVCWAPEEAQARKTAHEWWPNAALTGQLSQELALPAHFEQASQKVTQDDVAESVPCGPDPDRHVDRISKFLEAGIDRVYIHQVGPDQEGLFRFWESELRPRLQKLG